jgi:hypothetical protein
MAAVSCPHAKPSARGGERADLRGGFGDRDNWEREREGEKSGVLGR